MRTALQIGKLTPQERLQKILRYRAKRQMRNFNRTIKYQCRKSLADTRPRVRGRFARDNEPGSVMPHETKKAQRAKAQPNSGAATAAAAATAAGAGGAAGGRGAAAAAAAAPFAPMQAGAVQAPVPAPVMGHAAMSIPAPGPAMPSAASAMPAAMMAGAAHANGGSMVYCVPAPMQPPHGMGATHTPPQAAMHSASEQSNADVADMARLYNAWSELPLDAPLQV